MRILHWYPNFLAGGAVAATVQRLAAAQAAEGATVAIASAASAGEALYDPDELDEAVSLLRWQPRWSIEAGGIRLRGLGRRDRRRLRDFGADVVHVHGTFIPDNLRLPFLFDGPIVLSTHGSLHAAIFEKSRRLAKRAYVQLAKALYYRHLDAIHALTPIDAGYIQRVMPDKPLYCVPHGSGNPVAPAPAAPHEGTRLLFVGRLDVYTKGLDVLIDAFAAARPRLPAPATLTLVGPDWKGGRARLEAQAARLGVADAVHFSGSLPGTRVARYLEQADVYVQLSRHEGFSLSVTEALLSAKPAVLCVETGLASYPQIAGLPHVRTVPNEAPAAAAEALVALAGQAADLQQQAARYHAQLEAFFSWRRAAAAHLDAYGRLVARQPLPALSFPQPAALATMTA